MFDYRINKGLEHGMTPYEMFSGPAASAGGGTTGSGNVLGNPASQLAQQQMKIKQETNERAKDRETELTKVQMQTEASKQIAGVQADTTKRGQDLTYEVQQGNLQINQDTYRNITLPKAAQMLKKSVAETDKLLNEVATTRPVFIKFMKMLSMGVDNTLSAYLQNMYGYNLVDPKDVARIPQGQRKQILSTLLGIQSGTLKNIEGLKIFGEELGSKMTKPQLGRGKQKANDVTRHMINNAG